MFKHFGVRTAGMLAGAVALFAGVGYAATFALTPTPLVNAEAETLVIKCDASITVEKLDQWRNPVEGGAGAGGFYAEIILLKDVAPDCLNKWFNIVITGEQGQLLATSGWFQHTGTPTNPKWDVGGVAGPGVPVSAIHDIHVAVASHPGLNP